MTSLSEIVLYDLPKISLNKWYAGTHWTQRKKTKDKYAWAVRSQFKGLFPKTDSYDVMYEFTFKKNPLDASNCVAMAKMIEDVIFEDDKHDIIRSVTLRSRKGSRNRVKVTVKQMSVPEQKSLF